MLDTALGFRLSEDKPLVLGLMRDLGARTVPHARFSLSRLDRAEAFLREVGGSVVVKPAAGTGAGAGVTTGIHTGRGLRQAALIAAGFHEQLLVEQEITGSSYRLLYLGGELIDVIRRDPPSVEGDGAQTIRRLLDTENTRRLEADPIVSLHPITTDVECRTELRRQGRTLDSIPDRGERLAVKKVVNQNASRDNHRILSEIHPSVRDEGRRLSAALALDLVGVDILADDLGVPLADSGGFISELNAAPGLHHHVLVADPGSANVGATILEYVFAHGGTVPAHIRGE
jgi:cyanophycin synthetase